MLRVRTTWRASQGAPYLSTMYFTGLDGDAALAAASDVKGYWDFVAPVISNTCFYTIDPDVAQIDEETGTLQAEYSVGSLEGQGQSNGDLLPYTTQGLQQWSTGVVLGGRRLRGRTFVPGAVETNNTDGKPDAAYKLKIVQGGATLLAAADSELVVWSRKHQAALPVIGASCWAQWAELRSRRN